MTDTRTPHAAGGRSPHTAYAGTPHAVGSCSLYVTDTGTPGGRSSHTTGEGTPEAPRTLREFEAAARARLAPEYYGYFAGGAGDEVTVRANEAAFERLSLLPRVLRGAGRPRTDVALPGGRAA
ncbi:alpha-hydroxy-acid oxidizing protein, partial [Streptosporangium sp. NPDC048865]|uniref:alpha-hydroxy-acid oxidizing protein n=1 Tax=Streptosporangium sp. NPDC048865 TaxID=3155766 RepID=UPI00343D2C46